VPIGEKSSKMIFYILAILIVLLSIYLLKNGHFFERDLLTNYSDNPKVPYVKNGFNLAFLSTGESFFFGKILSKFVKSLS
jgi:hypothetical protein